jgi:hypothetical protein
VGTFHQGMMMMMNLDLKSHSWPYHGVITEWHDGGHMASVHT